jgi:hypothetical protein
MDEATLLEFEELLRRTEAGRLEPAFEHLGYADPESANFSPVDVQQAAFAGQMWWAANSDRVRAVVCSSDIVRAFAQDSDVKDLANVLLPLVAEAFGYAMTPSIGILIVRIGVKQFCGRSWSASNEAH